MSLESSYLETTSKAGGKKPQRATEKVWNNQLEIKSIKFHYHDSTSKKAPAFGSKLAFRRKSKGHSKPK